MHGSCKFSSEIAALCGELSECDVFENPLPPFSEGSLDSDKKVLFYAGLPNFKALEAVFDHVVNTLPVNGYCSLSLFQKFMCTILKLRLNDSIQNLAFLLYVSKATVSRVLLKWRTQMDLRLLSNLARL